MTDTAFDMEGVPVVIEIEGADEAVADDLRAIFDGDQEDVAFSHAFGGVDTVAIITTLGKATLGRLFDYFSRTATAPSKTKLKIGKSSIEMNGFSRSDIEALLASENFQKTVRAVKR